MRKVITLVILFTIQLFPSVWIERPTWYWNGERWVSQAFTSWARGRLWLYCNPVFDNYKEQWETPFIDSVSGNQWIRWSIEGQKTLWRIRKSGIFCGIGPIIYVKNNIDMVISFEGFENATNGATEVEKYYYFTDITVNEPNRNWVWISSRELNNYKIHLNSSNPSPFQGIKIWEKIQVEECDRAGEYIDPNGAIIILTLRVIRPWIDDEPTGFLKSLPIESSGRY